VIIKLQFLSICNAVHCIEEFVYATLIYWALVNCMSLIQDTKDFNK